MGNKSISYTITSSKSIDEVVAAVKTALRPVGGTIRDFGANGIQVTEGKEGISMAFLYEIEAMLKVVELGNNKFDIQCNITWKPSMMFWVCLIAGLFILVPWIANIAYAVIDPSKKYMEILYSLQSLV